MNQSTHGEVSYFGKIPARGDFVRHGSQHQLIAWLDRWAGEGLELMSQVPQWKQHYDNASAGHFAFIGTRNKTALCGHIRPSHDSSGRRFPLLAATRLDVTEPLSFLARSALIMQPAWGQLARLMALACTQENAEATLMQLAGAHLDIATSPSAYEAPYAAFLEQTSLGDLHMLLRDAGLPAVALKQLLPALGLLLQPLLSGGDVAIDKALAFPLPRDPAYRYQVAAFWLDLLAGFVARADLEISVLIANDNQRGMLVGFNGADRQILRAAMDPSSAEDFLIHIERAEWVEPYLAGDFNLSRLASYLDRSELRLGSARKLFGETFLGA